MKNRKNRILEILTENQKIEVVKLSEMLGVSQVTIRKDLDALAEMQIIKREHGFAMISDTNEILGRLIFHYEEKRAIAEKAAELIADGDTIMIESGSCCAILAETLAESRRNLTIITNSAFICDYIRKKTNFQIILLGGIYQHDSQVNVGPLVKQCAASFLVKYFFIGVDGWTNQTGFTGRDSLRVQSVRDMSESADQVVVLTESNKFLRHSTVPLNLSNKISKIYTDKNIESKTTETLSKQGIYVIS